MKRKIIKLEDLLTELVNRNRKTPIDQKNIKGLPLTCMMIRETINKPIE